MRLSVGVTEKIVVDVEKSLSLNSNVSVQAPRPSSLGSDRSWPASMKYSPVRRAQDLSILHRDYQLTWYT